MTPHIESICTYCCLVKSLFIILFREESFPSLSALTEPALTSDAPFGKVRVMDAFCLAATSRELQAVLPGVTIHRAQQLDRWSLLLVMHGGGEPGGLLPSVKPGTPRIELVSPPRKPGVHSSRFGDLLASKTREALIESVEQVRVDRIIAIHMRGGPLPEAGRTPRFTHTSPSCTTLIALFRSIPSSLTM